MERIPEPEIMDIPDEAEAYALADFADVNAAFVTRLEELTAAGEPSLALDLGTGPGDIPSRLRQVRPAWSIVAVDAAFPMLRLARAAVREAQVGWTQADAKTLPFPAACFDVVFSNSILHHITGVTPFWMELKRVATSNAFVFLRDLARPEDPEAARDLVDRYAGQESPLLQEEFYRSLLSAYTVDEVRAQLAEAGLDSLQVAMVTDRHLDVSGRIA